VGEPEGRRPRRGADRHVAGGQLSAFLDDELSETAALELTRHVVDCVGCRDELEALRVTRAALRDLSPRHAPVAASRTAASAAVRRRSRRLVRSSMVALAGVTLGVVSYVAGDTGQVVPPFDTFLLDHLAHTGDGPVPPPIGGPAR
jgi:anti-sigma factor RsiW